ncbi:bacteriocin immunity protein [Vagococcus acidifermentans]|nr:bacteriocin immunity protein [Vagococcus acidifermentans]
MKKREQEQQVLQQVNALLDLDISSEERKALAYAKKGLEKSDYFPSVIGALRNDLTPLAMRRSLSPAVSKFYLTVTNHKYMNKNFGGGLISTWANIFK